MRKILVSPGFGAGWSTWQHGVPQEFAATYQPIIEALERNEKLTPEHPAVQRYVEECSDRFHESHPCLLGLRDLTVMTVSDDAKVRITEYDGSESVEIHSEKNFW